MIFNKNLDIARHFDWLSGYSMQQAGNLRQLRYFNHKRFETGVLSCQLNFNTIEKRGYKSKNYLE